MTERQTCQCGVCVLCRNREAVRRYKERNRDRVRAEDLRRKTELYHSDPDYRERVLERSRKRQHRLWRESPEYRERITRYLKGLYSPEAHRAHVAVANAIKVGMLTRPATCEQCGRSCKPDAAHTDYEKRLEVRWLCRSCHIKFDLVRARS